MNNEGIIVKAPIEIFLDPPQKNWPTQNLDPRKKF